MKVTVRNTFITLQNLHHYSSPAPPPPPAVGPGLCPWPPLSSHCRPCSWSAPSRHLGFGADTANWCCGQCQRPSWVTSPSEAWLEPGVERALAGRRSGCDVGARDQCRKCRGERKGVKGSRVLGEECGYQQLVWKDKAHGTSRCSECWEGNRGC